MGFVLNFSWLALLPCFLDMAASDVHHVPDGMLNKCLNGTPNSFIENVRLYNCLDICRRVTICESLDYNFKTRRCILFDGPKADLGSLVTCQSFIHMDLVDWTEFHDGPCTSKPCQIHEHCVPNGESHVCDYLTAPEQTETGSTPGSAANGTSPKSATSTLGTTSTEPEQTERVTTPSLTTKFTSTEFETSTLGTTTRAPPCSMSLLDDSNAIPDSAFSASSRKSNSTLPNEYYAPKWARIETVTNGTIHGGGWMARDNNLNQYIQVKLQEVYRIFGATTRGYHGENAWVKSYHVSYGEYCSNTTFVRNFGGSPMVFNGNIDRNTKLFQIFYPNFYAKCIRFHPVTWENQIAMRLDLAGCILHD